MDTSLTDIIERIIKNSGSWDEARLRIINSLGASSVFQAEELALQIHGMAWLRESETWRAENGDALPMRDDRRPQMSGWGMRDGRKFGTSSALEEEAASQKGQVEQKVSFKENSVLRVHLAGEQIEANLNLSAVDLNFTLARTEGSAFRSRAAVVAFTLLVLATLFPPFYLPLNQGFQTNMGFAFLLAPPSSGQLLALVNVALLFAEYVAILLGTGLVMIWGPTVLHQLSHGKSS